ncbi:MAG: sulfurtransferase TusA family protein [Methylococcales bacterium]|nr:sulfurtransferase TusA family protein [Methylococcales bacterium]
MMNFTLEIDASGLNCPMPLLKLKKALNELNSEEVVKIIVTDLAAHLDFGVFCQQVGHEILTIHKAETSQIFFIKKA